MSNPSFTIHAKLWLYPSDTASWHFLTIPKDISAKIKTAKPLTKRGWGSVRVEAKIGKTIWQTSLFPDGKSGTYLLPVKAAVRNAEGIFPEDLVKLRITLLI